MEEYLKALITSMDEKSRCLRTLQEKTDEQTAILQAEEMDWDGFDALIDEKAELIEELDKLDDGFNTVFNRIREELDGKRAKYKKEIARLQEQIQEVTAQSTSLMATEQRNKELMEKLGVGSFQVLGLEKKVSTKIDGFKFEGYIDRLDSFLPGEVRIVDYKTGKVSDDDVDINPSTAPGVAAAIFGEENKGRPKIALQMFIYDIMVLEDPELKDKVIINSVYQPALLFREDVRTVPMCVEFKDDMMDRLHSLLAEMKDISLPWSRTSDETTCSYCDFKMICGR